MSRHGGGSESGTHPVAGTKSCRHDVRLCGRQSPAPDLGEPRPDHPAFCPKCDAPLRFFLYGQVARDLFSPWRMLLRLFGVTRPSNALICWECKEIVGYD